MRDHPRERSYWSNQRDNLGSVKKLLSFVKSTLKWRLMNRKPLSTWVHPSRSPGSSGRCVPSGAHMPLTTRPAGIYSNLLSGFPSLAISRARRRDRHRRRSGHRRPILARLVAFASSCTPTSILRPSVRISPFRPQKIYHHFLSALLTKLHHEC